MILDLSDNNSLHPDFLELFDEFRPHIEVNSEFVDMVSSLEHNSVANIFRKRALDIFDQHYNEVIGYHTCSVKPELDSYGKDGLLPQAMDRLKSELFRLLPDKRRVEEAIQANMRYLERSLGVVWLCMTRKEAMSILKNFGRGSEAVRVIFNTYHGLSGNNTPIEGLPTVFKCEVETRQLTRQIIKKYAYSVLELLGKEHLYGQGEFSMRGGFTINSSISPHKIQALYGHRNDSFV